MLVYVYYFNNTKFNFYKFLIFNRSCTICQGHTNDIADFEFFVFHYFNILKNDIAKNVPNAAFWRPKFLEK